ncbi:MAG TPA: hypothetical protein VEB60_00640 [Candidatus Paceibacterota bacterium]|nr:hypothetical protein [Candidatus Paceibacterota bacterium]
MSTRRTVPSVPAEGPPQAPVYEDMSVDQIGPQTCRSLDEDFLRRVAGDHRLGETYRTLAHNRLHHLAILREIASGELGKVQLVKFTREDQPDVVRRDATIKLIGMLGAPGSEEPEWDGEMLSRYSQDRNPSIKEAAIARLKELEDLAGNKPKRKRGASRRPGNQPANPA